MMQKWQNGGFSVFSNSFQIFLNVVIIVWRILKQKEIHYCWNGIEDVETYEW